MATEQVDGEFSPHIRWNLTALMLDVTFFALGMAFIDSSAVIPLLMERLGAAAPLIGAFASLRFLAFSLLQIFVAYALHGKDRQKPWLAFVATITRLPLLALPWFLWNADRSDSARQLALWATIGILTFWALGDGLGYVPWMEIVARAFSARTRGRFFASSQIVSGAASILIGAFVVRTILHTSRLPFPTNYAVLAAIAALLFQVSLLGVLLIREPDAPLPPIADVEAVRHTPASYARRLPNLMRNDPIFVRLSVIQLLLGFGAAAAPFYVLYATRRFHLGDEWGGTYQALQALGVVVLTPLWTFLSEKRSPASAVQGLATVCLLTPLVALTIGNLSPWIFGLVFFLMGGSLGWCLWIVMNHFLLSHIEEGERPVLVALINLLFLPSALYPYFGGLLIRKDRFVSVHGMPALFLLTALVVAFGFALSLRLTPGKEGKRERGKRTPTL